MSTTILWKVKITHNGMLIWYNKKNHYLNNCTCSTGDNTRDAEKTTLELKNKSYGLMDAKIILTATLSTPKKKNTLDRPPRHQGQVWALKQTSTSWIVRVSKLPNNLNVLVHNPSWWPKLRVRAYIYI